MPKLASILKSEEGAALILSLLILSVVTIIGISAMNTSTIEMQIAGNDAFYKQSFYLAEAAAMEAIQQAENQRQADLEALQEASAVNFNKDNPDAPMEDTDNWDSDDIGADNAETSDFDGDGQRDAENTIVDEGIAKGGGGGSLELSDPGLHTLVVYGLHESAAGKVLIEVGYRLRF